MGPPHGGANLFTWDTGGLLRKVTAKNGVTTRFTYDALARRMMRELTKRPSL